jgi:hypothetical protein
MWLTLTKIKMDLRSLNTCEVSKMTPDQAARIIQKAWFKHQSWCVAQKAEYRDTPVPWVENPYYFDEEIECLFA